jgi:hypothetical protein
VRVARGLAVDRDAEGDGRARSRAQDEMDVAGMEAEGDSAAGFVLSARSIVQFPPRAQVLS